jgi:short-chain fatty acids transporter
MKWSSFSLARILRIWARKLAFFIPHSFLLSLFLTFVVYFLGIFWAYHGPFDMIKFWANGFWSFLGFSMQMVVMILSTFSIASVPFIRKIIRRLVDLLAQPRRGLIFLILATGIISWIYWGLGMVVGAVIAREMGRRISGIDYPLLVAGAYSGIWAGSFGPFAFIPLAVSQPGHFLEKFMGLYPLSQTSLSSFSILVSGLSLILISLFMGLICPPSSEANPPLANLLRRFDEEDREEDESLLAEKKLREGRIPLGLWLEHSRWPVWWISLMAFSYLVYWFYGRGFEINLNILNLFLFIFALLLHDTPARFLSSMERSIRPIYGIIVQFPFYAAIQGMLISSGLATIFFQWLLANSSLNTYPFLLYLNAILINFFLPTSEAIWEAQGLLVIKSAQTLGVHLPQAINIFTAGELLANLIHPFWTIPILGICGISIREIMGYCLFAFIILSALWITCFTFFLI